MNSPIIQNIKKGVEFFEKWCFSPTDFLDMRLRTRNQIEMKYYVGRLRETMSKAIPKRVLACTVKTFKKFKAVSAHNRLISKQTIL